MSMKPYMQRLAELWIMQTKKGGRGLNTIEAREFNHCMNLLVNDAYEHAKLFNLSLIAFEVNDTEWQHELCRKIEEQNY